MSLFFASIPYFPCLVRREYTRDMKVGHGEFLTAYVIAVECRRGRMLGFQCLFSGETGAGATVPTAGAMFRLPIEALAWKPSEKPTDVRDYAPYGCLSDEFSVVTLEFLHEMRAYVLPKRLPGYYVTTVHFGRSDLCEDPEQSKNFHLIRMDDGFFAAVPNNRLLIEDLAFFEATKDRPDFVALTRSFLAD